MQGARHGTRSRDSRIMPWAEGSAKPLSHPGCPDSYLHLVAKTSYSWVVFWFGLVWCFFFFFFFFFPAPLDIPAEFLLWILPSPSIQHCRFPGLIPLPSFLLPCIPLFITLSARGYKYRGHPQFHRHQLRGPRRIHPFRCLTHISSSVCMSHCSTYSLLSLSG